jgi:hypothetical protein
MGWNKARREAKLADLEKFIEGWGSLFTLLDELLESHRAATDPSQKRTILYEYSRLGAECWAAIVNDGMPPAFSVDFERHGLQAYFPSGYPSPVEFANWAGRNRIGFESVKILILCHMSLWKDKKKYQDTGDPGTYFYHLTALAETAHHDLKRLFWSHKAQIPPVGKTVYWRPRH